MLASLHQRKGEVLRFGLKTVYRSETMTEGIPRVMLIRGWERRLIEAERN